MWKSVKEKGLYVEVDRTEHKSQKEKKKKKSSKAVLQLIHSFLPQDLLAL